MTFYSTATFAMQTSSMAIAHQNIDSIDVTTVLYADDELTVSTIDWLHKFLICGLMSEDQRMKFLGSTKKHIFRIQGIAMVAIIMIGEY